MNQADDDATTYNPFSESSEPTAMITQLMQMGWSQTEILFISVEMARRLSTDVGAMFERSVTRRRLRNFSMRLGTSASK